MRTLVYIDPSQTISILWYIIAKCSLGPTFQGVKTTNKDNNRTFYGTDHLEENIYCVGALYARLAVVSL